MAATWWLGMGFGLGFEPTPTLPAWGAELFPVELRREAERTLAVQVDPVGAALDAALTSRRQLGAAVFVERERDLGAVRTVTGLGGEALLGIEAIERAGQRVRVPAVGLAPAGRIGLVWRGERSRASLGLRAALGARSDAGQLEPWARALGEASVTWRAR